VPLTFLSRTFDEIDGEQQTFSKHTWLWRDLPAIAKFHEVNAAINIIPPFIAEFSSSVAEFN